MSRIGRKAIEIPEKVEIALDGQTVKTKGPKGELSYTVNPKIKVESNDGKVEIKRASDSPEEKALHGLTRSLIQNMVQGVTEGYTKELSIVGVGVKAEIKGKELVMQLGFTHPINYAIADDIELKCTSQTHIVVSGIDKQRVGQVAAEIRRFCPPEPYKGKGIRYVDEVVRRKQGKKVGG